ncbi:substrate-binding domain-containing protein [Escherichia coli]
MHFVSLSLKKVSRSGLSGVRNRARELATRAKSAGRLATNAATANRIIAVTDARARHILQVCEHLHIPVPEKLCVIGIDNEELTRYLSRVALSSVAQGARQMGYQAAKLLHRLLDKEEMPLQRILVPPVRVIERRSTDYRSLTDRRYSGHALHS